MNVNELVLYSGAIPFIKVEGERAIFGSDNNENIHWGDDQNGRVVEGTRFEVDKKFWELLGEPEELAIGFSTGEGWEDNWKKKVGEFTDDR